MSVLLELSTSIGNIVVDLFYDKAPAAAKNFLKLCKSKYYYNVLIYSVEKDFICRTGDPTGTGTGSNFVQNDPVPQSPNPLSHCKGSIGYVPDAEGNVGSAFYITLGDDVKYLDANFQIFGEVQEGFDALKKINNLYCDQNNRPYIDNRIKRTTVLYDPWFDPNFTYPSSPKGNIPEAETVEQRIAADEDIDPNEGKTKSAMKAQIRQETARANAVGRGSNPDGRPSACRRKTRRQRLIRLSA